MACHIPKQLKADASFESYDFGDGVTIVDHDNWDTDNPADYTKLAYVEYDDDGPDKPSHKLFSTFASTLPAISPRNTP